MAYGRWSLHTLLTLTLNPPRKALTFPSSLTLWRRPSHFPGIPEALLSLTWLCPHQQPTFTQDFNHSGFFLLRAGPPQPGVKAPFLPEAEGKSLTSALSLFSKDNCPSGAKPHAGLVGPERYIIQSHQFWGVNLEPAKSLTQMMVDGSKSCPVLPTPLQ